jgi:hypothetical protein
MTPRLTGQMDAAAQKVKEISGRVEPEPEQWSLRQVGFLARLLAW